MAKNNSQSAFTLIELLIVIAIIGLLASIVMVSLGSARSKARDVQRKANLKQIQTALELYYNDNGSYPSTSGTWYGESSAYGSHTLTGASGYIPNLAPTYVASLPHDPLTGTTRTSFNSACTNVNTNYIYISNGVDYKLATYCLIESTPTSSDPFYDPPRWTISYSVYTAGYLNQ